MRLAQISATVSMATPMLEFLSGKKISFELHDLFSTLSVDLVI